MQTIKAFITEHYVNLIGDHIIKPPEHDELVAKYPHLKDHFYQRDIGGHKHTKIILGHPGNDYKKDK